MRKTLAAKSCPTKGKTMSLLQAARKETADHLRRTLTSLKDSSAEVTAFELNDHGAFSAHIEKLTMDEEDKKPLVVHTQLKCWIGPFEGQPDAC
jgi:outer membrane lipoprotein-sorting protein